MPRQARWLIAIGVLSCTVAFAQTEADGPQTRSLWAIVLDGLEWPGYLVIAGSVATIMLIVEHFLTVRRSEIAPAEQIKKARQAIERRDLRGCHTMLRSSRTFFAQVMTAALPHAAHGVDAMRSTAIEKSSELGGRMYRKVEYLNILGNLGPLMGLLGTVLGMIFAFGALGDGGSEGGGQGGQLARGISLALVNTLLGLTLAVLGIGFFGACRNRIEAFTTEATVEALDLLEYLRAAPRGYGDPPVAAEV
ncbi:MAG: MotA/TolQ/ExbB proton channel family protein [Phycisphaerales bacterium]|nr:MotA/TolQ/ExbB proton channel family protein [Phycisphaerales bacterium]